MEQRFRAWYGGWSERLGLNPDPDDPRHQYDYRAAFQAGARPMRDEQTGEYHWPSAFKLEGHPNRFVGGVDTITGTAPEQIPGMPEWNEMRRVKPELPARPPFDFGG